jgi:hypothetical protein
MNDLSDSIDGAATLVWIIAEAESQCTIIKYIMMYETFVKCIFILKMRSTFQIVFVKDVPSTSCRVGLHRIQQLIKIYEFLQALCKFHNYYSKKVTSVPDII